MRLWPGTRIRWHDDPTTDREIVMVRRTGYTWQYANAPGMWLRTDREADPWFDDPGWSVVQTGEAESTGPTFPTLKDQ